ncbi:MAG: hypothetical protein AABW58_03585 [Nanoarchaeota archaeon]
MRDDNWLNQRLEHIWSMLFDDVPKENKVQARFKGKWKNKFGHIRLLKSKNSEIAVNSLFKNPVIPEYIIDITLAHELVHYSHGFNSPLKKLYKHPHKGNIVEKELKKRGFENMIKLEKDFVKTKWFKLYKLLTYL